MPKLTRMVDIRAKNNIYEEARQRVLEVAPAAAEDWANSNFVEAYPIYYYSVAERGLECTCQSMGLGSDGDDESEGTITDDLVANNGDGPLDPAEGPGADGSFIISYNREDHESMDDSDGLMSEPPVSDELIEEPSVNQNQGEMFLDDVFADGIDCAICQRQKVQPGYSLAEGQRHVLTSLNMVNHLGATLRTSDRPHAIEINLANGYVEWSIVVPKYYTKVRFNVYDNTHLLDSDQYVLMNGGSVALTASHVNAARGTTLTVRLYSRRFTHVSVEFDLATKGLRASLPQLQKLRAYDRFVSIPVTTIIIENRVMARIHDVIWCPPLSLMWKVTEIKPLTLVNNFQVGWELQARIVQPLEQALLQMPALTEIR